MADKAAQQSTDLAVTVVWRHRLGGKLVLQCLSSDAQTWHFQSCSPGMRLHTSAYTEIWRSVWERWLSERQGT